MGRIEIHEDIILKMHETYLEKNSDYGNSFTMVRKKYPGAILVRLNDKLSRIETLMQSGNQKVKDESIDDTLLDLANYCVMELIERRLDKQLEVEHAIRQAMKGCGVNVVQFPFK